MAGEYIVVESIFIITVLLAVSFFSTTIMAAFQDIQQAEKMRLNRLKESIQNDVTIIFAVASDGVVIWAKNTGEGDISPGVLKSSDLFLIGRRTYQYLRYSNTPPGWNYSIAYDINGDGVWSRGETIVIYAALTEPLPSGEYVARLVVGQTRAEYLFSVG
ncbi:hypothetical protein HRbin01_00601 [archaeon HR01]|nr:hypothetical protein HRbin01_00601 [archaeon HR01]